MCARICLEGFKNVSELIGNIFGISWSIIGTLYGKKLLNFHYNCSSPGRKHEN
jgi:hypothetical protein